MPFNTHRWDPLKSNRSTRSIKKPEHCRETRWSLGTRPIIDEAFGEGKRDREMASGKVTAIKKRATLLLPGMPSRENLHSSYRKTAGECRAWAVCYIDL
jgi:hypothetical protein